MHVLTPRFDQQKLHVSYLENKDKSVTQIHRQLQIQTALDFYNNNVKTSVAVGLQ